MLVVSACLLVHEYWTAGPAWNPMPLALLEQFGVLVLLSSVAMFGFSAAWRRREEAAHRAILAEQQRWRLALEAVGDGTWEHDLRTGELTWSEKWRELHGAEGGRVPHNEAEYLEWIHPDDRGRVECEFRAFNAGAADTLRTEFRLGECGGTYRWVLSRARIVERDGSGRPRRAVGTHSDITVRKELEQRLQEQAARYQTLFEQNPHPMAIYAIASHRILAVNDFAVQKYGYTREQFLGMTALDLCASEEISRVRRELAETKDSVRSSGPWRHRRADGEIIVVEIMSHEITWEGAPARVVVSHDITAQQRAAQDLEASEEKFRRIYETAHDAILLLDENGRISDGNPQAQSLFGVGLAELVGRVPGEFSPRFQADGQPSAEKAARLIQQARRRVVPAFEWQHLRPDGSCFESEITLSPVHWDHRDALLVIVRDITERKRATEQLQLLQAALHATPAGIVITDASGNIEWTNPAFTRLTGFTLEEVAGQNPRVLRSGEHDEVFYREMWETIARGDVWSGELHNRRKDGTHYEERMTIAPVRNARGSITHYVAVKEDVTNERHLEQQLARAQRLESVGMLASGIAHDLNNVLTPIILSVELLKATEASPQMRERLELVAQSAQRGAGIVKQVLTFARGVDGERTLVQPRYLVKEVAQLAEETFPRNIEVRVETGRDVGAVFGDVTQLHQVLLNLAVNARDAMPAGGRLVLGARNVVVDAARASLVGRIEPGEFVELTASDTGSGMSEEVLEHLFEPFFTTKPRGKGTGLGLSTAYGIVRSHGGGIDVRSKLGVGTTFRVLLPVHRGLAAAPSAAATANEIRGEGRVVLLVDDEEPIRVVAEHVLRRQGFEVVTAADGVQALELFRLRPQGFALAVIDQMMPRMGGAALIRELRLLAPDLRVISSTGLSGEPGSEQSDAEELAALGVRTRLPKPYTSAELLLALRRELLGSSDGPAPVAPSPVSLAPAGV